MALSPNYGWAEPDNSSLVKNGAQDIRTLGDAIDTSLWNVGYGQAGKNKVINGNMAIWQRGTSFASGTPTYTADRFQGYRQTAAAGATFSQQTTGLDGFQYCLRAQRNSGNTSTTFVRIASTFETSQVKTLHGRSLVLSFYARRGSDLSSTSFNMVCNVEAGTGTDSNIATGFTGQVTLATLTQALTASWVRYEVDIPTLSNTYNQLGFYMQFTPTGTASTNDYIEITGVQLEVGNYMTPFQTATGTIQGELAACQRYYYRIFPNSTQKLFGVATAASTTAGGSIIYFPVKMRTAPTALEQSGTANEYAVNFAGVQTTCSAVPTFQSFTTENSAFVTLTVTAGLIAGQGGRFVTDITNGTNAYLGWSAEL
jgi:hypothetical protein